MLVPEPEPPKNLQRSEVEANLERFVRDAGEMARVKKLARILAHGLRAMNAEDLLQTAMTRLLEEGRSWPRGLPTFLVLQGVMRSVASNARKKRDYLLAEDLGPAPTDDPETEPSPVGEGVSPEANPARVIEAECELAAVQNAVAGDEDLELLVEALADGLTGNGIAEELGWDGKKYDAARKRLSRRLAGLKADRS
jgi:DNA-directed RNA polymerase specialized sigma24 family protein